MWYLIIPPVVVIASLALLIWFLANRAKQPSIQERMDDIAKRSSFREWQSIRLKQILFRSLEKSMRSLKVLTLRVHNAFHTMGQSMRERRHQSDLLVTSLLNLKKEKEESSRKEAGVSLGERERVFPDIPSRETSKENRPVLISIPKEEEAVSVEQSAPAEARPMVSERMVVPEVKPKKFVSSDDQREEERLIKRIAANPKSVSAYEALGDYYLERGDTNDAKACYRQVLKLSPVHRMVKVKIRKLERLIEKQKGE